MSPVRRGIFILVLTFCVPLFSVAQTNSSPIGQLVYYEGSVEVKSPNGGWSEAQIEQGLSRNHLLRTGPQATVEIKWQNGIESTVGPDVEQKVGPLYDQVSSSSTKNTEGIVDKFVNLFQGQSSGAEDVGGIRRASVKIDEHSEPGQLYWKTFEEVSFEEAQQQFKGGNYPKALRSFHLFLQQHPDHPKAAKAKLGMGLSYLKLNNPDQARTTLKSLVRDHPQDPLADRARKLLNRL